MPRIKDKIFVTFNDGVLDICGVKDRVITDTKAEGVRYGKHTVGYKKFFEAKVASVSVDKVLYILPVPGISQSDICVVDDEQYKILLIQEKMDAYPPCLQLNLQRIVTKYKDGRDGH